MACPFIQDGHSTSPWFRNISWVCCSTDSKKKHLACAKWLFRHRIRYSEFRALPVFGLFFRLQLRRKQPDLASDTFTSLFADLNRPTATTLRIRALLMRDDFGLGFVPSSWGCHVFVLRGLLPGDSESQSYPNSRSFVRDFNIIHPQRTHIWSVTSLRQSAFVHTLSPAEAHFFFWSLPRQRRKTNCGIKGGQATWSSQNVPASS